MKKTPDTNPPTLVLYEQGQPVPQPDAPTLATPQCEHDSDTGIMHEWTGKRCPEPAGVYAGKVTLCVDPTCKFKGKATCGQHCIPF